MVPWNIDILFPSIGGFAPAFYKESYPSYGEHNQAGAMQNMDMTNAGFMTQGPGLANLTNGTQAAAVTTLIKGILEMPAASGVTYAIGGNLLYQLSSTTVTSSGTWPHTIDKAAVTGEDGEDVARYQGNLYYTYNHSGSAGDIGMFDLSSTFDDDWGSTTPSGAAALQGGVPHPIEIGGNDKMYIGNGRYVCSYDGTTLIPQALDLPTNTVIMDLRWVAERLYITANRPYLTGSNKNYASIYIWDGTTDSWETEIVIKGFVNGLHVRNGVAYVWYRDHSNTGGYKLAYVSGGAIVDLCSFTGALPAFYQKTDYKDFIIWVSDALVWAWGSGDRELPVRTFQLADGGYSTVGGLAAPFGTPMVASNESTNYKLAQFSGYDTACNWKSLVFDVIGDTGNARINTMVVNFEELASGASVGISLKNNRGQTIYSDTISYAKATDTVPKHTLSSVVYRMGGLIAENFRVEFDYSTGSTSNPVKIKNVRIYGDTNQSRQG